MPVSANEPQHPSHQPQQPLSHATSATNPATPLAESGRFSIELEQEVDGRWIAEVLELPGVLAYGDTRQLATLHVKVLALRVLADQLEHGEAADQLDAIFPVVP